METLRSPIFWTGVAAGIGITTLIHRFVGVGDTGPSFGLDDDSDDSAVCSSGDESEYSEVEDLQDTKMVLVVRNDLKMGKGKAAAQCSHATLAAYKQARRKNPDVLRVWECNGQPKITLKCDSEDELMTMLAQARSLNLVSAVIADAGRTQIEPGSKTVLAIGPAPISVIDQVTGKLKLY
eukprot:TRINITY_DN5064_c0_g2_i2.p1 TRINITY_DN5064_c0_g2~~TRINITY_DN5064_c0_g2_i2.p1  ORF type:complete len:180 (-),score=13.60 TRINITY_DN5064_c0_g2_i2:432-971(-)